MENRLYCILALFLFLVLVPHTAQALTVSVSCLPASFTVGGTGTTCIASVSGGNSPTGSITPSSSGSGSVSSPSPGCTDITKGACTFTLTDSVVESLTITATYSEDSNKAVVSAGATQVTVDPSTADPTSISTTNLDALLPWIGEGISVVIAIAIAIAYPGMRKKKKQ